MKADNWPQYQHDIFHTGRTNDLLEPSDLSLIWSAPYQYNPIILGSSVYGTTYRDISTILTSFSLANGSVNWRYRAHNLYFGTAAARDQIVVLFGFDFDLGYCELNVLDSATGERRFIVTLPQLTSFPFVAPTLSPDDSTGDLVAYCTDGSSVTAISLHANAGRTRWTQTGSFGGLSIPTVVGDSIVLAGPGQYYAFDQMTGAANHFHAGDISGGGGVTVAFDPARSEFYIVEDYSTQLSIALSAYHYQSNDEITLLWQRSGAVVDGAGSAAIGVSGNVYVAANDQISEINPDDGSTLRTIPGSFANGATPAIGGGVIWAYSASQTLAYDLTTLHLIHAFAGSPGNSSGDSGPGALTNQFAVLNDITGFHVYQETR